MHVGILFFLNLHFCVDKDLALDENYDWDIYNKRQFVVGKEKARQQAVMLLQLQQGSWLYNTNMGLLLRQYVLGQRHPQYQLFFSQITEALQKIQGIKTASVADYDIVDKTLIVGINLTFDDGETERIEYKVNNMV